MTEDINKAIEHFTHGISHDMFNEPVKSYAKLAVEALKNYKASKKGCCDTKKTKATIYDLHRICKNHKDCYSGDEHTGDCPLAELGCDLGQGCTEEELNKKNDIVMEWVLNHPLKTRQDVFLEQHPKAPKDGGILVIPPCNMDESYARFTSVCDNDCNNCRREYCLGEAEV